MMIQAATLVLPGIRHAFFTRNGGVSDGVYATLNGGIGSADSAANVAENRARMAAKLGVEPDRLLTAYQTHSPLVVIVDAPWPSRTRPRADAVVTRTRALAVGVTTADCAPLLLADPLAGVVGAAHAGWRGALAGIVEATIDAMEQLGAVRSRLRVGLGPTIRQGSYEVGPDLRARFAAEDPQGERFFRRASRDGHALFDLAGYIAARLKRAGVGEVEDLRLCTYADADRFFSFRRSTHRAEADYGRHVNAIALA